ncbi:MAG: MFS transporter [Planctomycetota bacterium]
MPDPARRTPLWRNLNFSLMWTSTAASGFGDRMLMLSALALMGAMEASADASAANAATQFFFVLPYVLLSLTAGWLADHLPRKWLLLACDEGRALLILISILLVPAAGAAAIPEEHFWKIYLALFGLGVCAATFNSVRNAIVPQLVPRNQLQSANAVILTISVVFGMLGLILGPQIIDVDDSGTLRTALFLGFALYFVSGTFFAFLKPREHRFTQAIADHETDETDEDTDDDRATPKRSLADGFAYVFSHTRILSLILINAGIWGIAALVYSAVPAIAKVNYALTGQELLQMFAYLGGAIGFGMLAGAVAMGLIATRKESPILLYAGMCLAGLCVLGLVISPYAWLGLPLAFGVGFFGQLAIVATITLIQTQAPNYIRGRVMGITAVIDNGAMVVLYFAVWQLPNADASLPWILMVAGPMMAALGLVLLVRFLRSGPVADNRLANMFIRVARLLGFSVHRLQIYGKHHVPCEGPVIIAPNHTVALDPFIIQAGCRRLIRWLMAEDQEYGFAGLLWKAADPVILPKDAGRSAAVRAVLRSLENNVPVGIFPEGGLQREHRELGAFQPGVAMIARRAQCPIVPVWVSGTPRANHMLLHFLKPSKSVVRFGEPFTVAKDAKPDDILAELRRRMLALVAESGDTHEPQVPASPTD